MRDDDFASAEEEGKNATAASQWVKRTMAAWLGVAGFGECGATVEIGGASRNE
jgi:hypothetical protein